MDTIESLLEKVREKLKDSRIYYLSNDPERALGLEKLLPYYSIVHIDNNEYLDDFEKNKIENFCLANATNLSQEFFRSSIKLINSPEFLDYFNSTKAQTNYFQTFKISPAFELATNKLDAKLLNTKAELNRLYEDKITQFQILSKLPISLPKTVLGILGNFSYFELSQKFGAKFVIQFARGHTGSSTVFIEDSDSFEKIQNEFEQRMVKISEHVEGLAYTLNCCCLKQGVVMGGLSKQITGDGNLTPMAGGTVGNDWSNHNDFINGKQKLIEETKLIGEQMIKDGYLGLFGLDLIVKGNGEHAFIEINARQPASIPMYTKMQLKNGEIPLSLLHISEFLGIEYSINISEYNEKAMQEYNYSQIFIRSFEDIKINSRFPSGSYRLQGDNAGFDPIKEQRVEGAYFLDEAKDKCIIKQKDAYSIDELENSEGILVLTQSNGRVIKFNDEFARIQLNSNAIQDNNGIKGWIVEILRAIYNYQK